MPQVAQRLVRPVAVEVGVAVREQLFLQQLLFESGDAKEGIAANLEKRTPNFSVDSTPMSIAYSASMQRPGPVM